MLGVLSAQRPAQIANYEALSAAPSLLAVGLAAGAVTALFLTLFASVRRRRRDLAVLKTIGFTRRQLAATVAWQATVAAAVRRGASQPGGRVPRPISGPHPGRPGPARGVKEHLMIEGTLIAESIRVGVELEGVRLVTRKAALTTAALGTLGSSMTR